MTGTPSTPRDHRTRGRIALGLSGAALAALLAACGGGGGGSGSSSTPAPAPAPSSGTSGTTAATQVKADLTDFHITLSQQTFHAGPYTFVAKNDGQHEHALEIEGGGTENRTETLAPGESATLTVTLKSGTYQVYCPVDSHKDLGMKTQITVGGTGGTTPTTPTTPSDGNGHGNGDSPGTGY
ncbi:cupredoxin domain-containing protein [Streptomyces sp. NBC_01268]|uniref:cupredoxin domain-containing protein n=1 Tax=Streptomyces sp. NBC_01268 TaxID=2903806 RepID=UPI002E36E9DA|nr:cupredoxin domain-containing protein [Streptomyces sp. NBC_01268]